MRRKYYTNQQLEKDMDLEMAEFCKATSSADGMTRYKIRKDTGSKIEKRIQVAWHIIGGIGRLISKVIKKG